MALLITTCNTAAFQNMQAWRFAGGKFNMSSIEEKQTLTEGSSDLAFQSEEGDVSTAFVEAGEEGDMPMPTAAGPQQPAPLVLMKHILPPKSTLELKEDFKAHQGSNGVWEARPPVLHFGGYTPNRPHKQVHIHTCVDTRVHTIKHMYT